MIRLLLFALAVFALGCEPVTGPERERVAGIIAGVQPDDPHIVVPDTVEVGETFTVTVRTYGLSSCWEKGETEVEEEGSAVVVAPYDIKVVGDVACTDEVQVFQHTATLRFEEAGPAEVIVIGRVAPEGAILLAEVPVVVLAPSSALAQADCAIFEGRGLTRPHRPCYVRFPG